MQTTPARDIALAQAALEHALYFLDLGAVERAAAYFQFAAHHLQISTQRLMGIEPVLLNP
ncbi:MAG TPA: hypothetical protein V6C78_24915 [Crinalium sp.]|jgi:hypothetical protein